MMRVCAAAALLPVCLQAAVIRGVVVENLMGRPLARAIVVLQPVGSTAASERTARANGMGGFEFESLPAGAYILRASRKGFMSSEYGQKRWNSAGTPVVVEESETAFVNMRLLRYSAITGRIVDQNDIGLPDQEIVAYRLRTPAEVAVRARTDDRGRYRLYGLEPGTYTVRTAAQQYIEDSYLPTFPAATEKLPEARTVDLFAEQQADGVDVRPVAGSLCSIAVEARSFPPGAVIRLTLASEMGRTTVLGTAYQFTGLAPGTYDVYAETNAQPGDNAPAAYQRIAVSHDTKVTLLAETPIPVVIASAPDGDSGRMWFRHKDLAGTGETFTAALVHGRAAIPAGRWEVMLQPPAGYYVSSVMGTGGPQGRADGWNEIVGRGYIRFSVAAGPGGVRGTVRNSGDAVAGAPVYLEGWDGPSRKRVGELKTTRTDMRGVYSFDGLAPGEYRVLSTFEYSAPEAETMGEAATEVTVDAQAAKTQDLDLYVIR